MSEAFTGVIVFGYPGAGVTQSPASPDRSRLLTLPRNFTVAANDDHRG
ncbi:MAG: hypothetical protein VKK42_22780 [Lyngbya sp.]|nr:hypothetical protein [Lyngbya sp.]